MAWTLPSALVGLTIVALLPAPLAGAALIDHDCGTGGDAGDDFVSATPIPRDVECAGGLPPGDEDWFLLDVLAGETINVAVDPATGIGIDLSLVDPSGNLIQCACWGGSGSEDLSYRAPSAGAYRVRIELMAWSQGGSYLFAASVGTPDDCGTGDDAGNFYWAPYATLIGTPADCVGGISPADPFDHYLVEVERGQTIHVTLAPRPHGARFEVCVLPPSYQYQSLLAPFGGVCNDSLGGTSYPAYAFEFCQLSAEEGTWRIGVWNDEHSSGVPRGDYDLRVRVGPILPIPYVGCTHL